MWSDRYECQVARWNASGYWTDCLCCSFFCYWCPSRCLCSCSSCDEVLYEHFQGQEGRRKAQRFYTDCSVFPALLVPQSMLGFLLFPREGEGTDDLTATNAKESDGRKDLDLFVLVPLCCRYCYWCCLHVTTTAIASDVVPATFRSLSCLKEFLSI